MKKAFLLLLPVIIVVILYFVLPQIFKSIKESAEGTTKIEIQRNSPLPLVDLQISPLIQKDDSLIARIPS